MSRAISGRARSYIRSRATGNMAYQCRIERLGEPDMDDDTLIIAAATRTTIYTGVCRIWEVSSGSPVSITEESIVLQTTQLSIPWNTTTVPVRDDEVIITASVSDPAMVGKRFRILDSAKGGDLRASRRFTVQGIQEEG